MKPAYVVEWVNEGDGYNRLVRTSDGQQIFQDGMEPEDAQLSRDLAPLVKELNRLAESKLSSTDALVAPPLFCSGCGLKVSRAAINEYGEAYCKETERWEKAIPSSGGKDEALVDAQPRNVPLEMDKSGTAVQQGGSKHSPETLASSDRVAEISQPLCGDECQGAKCFLPVGHDVHKGDNTHARVTWKVEGQNGDCTLCGGPMSRNPHPEAGQYKRMLEVGTTWVCIPCTVKTRHAWCGRALKAERETEAQAAEIIQLRQIAEHVRALVDFQSMDTGVYRTKYPKLPTFAVQSAILIDLKMLLDAVDTARPWVPSDGDTKCQRCFASNITWFTDSRLWNEVMPDGGVLCVSCFAAEFAKLHPSTVWKIVPENLEPTK